MRTPLRGLFALFVLVLGVLAPTPVLAQRALQQVLDLNRQGMEAYNNLEIEQALSLLQQALAAAERGGVTGAPLARTYANLGVVSIGGMGDNGAGLDYFIRAVQADATVQLDPLTSTPDIAAVFALARTRAGTASGGGGGGGGGGASTGGGGASTGGGGGGGGGGTTGGSGGGASGSGDLPHRPIPEQLAQTPVPVYLEIPGSPAHVYIYYRGHGMREFQRVEMERVGRGWGFEIPCTDVFEPQVEYYIVAFATDGSPLGFAGTQSDPYSVPIVGYRTEAAPALPGRAPPATCGDEECPPGMAGCGGGGGGGGGSGGRRGLGDSCRRDSDCASNHCDDDMCAAADSDGGGGGGGGGATSAGPAFFLRASGGLGLSYVSPGLQADRPPCAPGEWQDGFPCQEIEGFPGAASITSVDTAAAAGRAFGYDPGISDTCGLDTLSGEFPDERPWCFYVETPGLVLNGSIRLELGYYVHPMIAPRLVMRFQPSSGNGPLSFMLIGAGLELNLTPEVAEGFHAHLHIDGGGGQIQTFLGRGDRNATAPWARSGLGFLEVGGTLGYRFVRNVGIHLTPDFVFNLPEFVFTLDLNAGLEVAF